MFWMLLAHCEGSASRRVQRQRDGNVRIAFLRVASRSSKTIVSY